MLKLQDRIQHVLQNLAPAAGLHGYAMGFGSIVIFSCLAAGLAAWGAWYLIAAPTSQTLCPAISSGKSAGQVLALTFDDGPGPETAQILDILRRHEVRATFFLCGENVEKYPEMVRRLAAEGHCVGSHGYSHLPYPGKSRRWMKHDIEHANSIIRRAMGAELQTNQPAPLTLFRPPYGLRWFGLAGVLEDLGLTAVMWNVSSEDWKRTAGQISARVIKRATGGSIILMHDGVPPSESSRRSNSVAALPRILEELSGRYQFVTVDELLQARRKSATRQDAIAPQSSTN